MAQRVARPEWPAVLQRQLRLAGDRAQVSRDAEKARYRTGPKRRAAVWLDGTPEAGVRAGSGSRDLPPSRPGTGRSRGHGETDRTRRTGAAAQGRSTSAAAIRTAAAFPAPRFGAATGWSLMSRSGRPAVHQVLATLGYGDAIGHEVLGIQRVLREAGYQSDIF